ncbi:GNAT family N-acetyltransferase [Acinetobacter sp. RIT592]|jgi:GNAT superfamily N-acetyltransferase|nr:GNAT family N-acetyltransferase [Parabacteroides merdae]RDC48707.1 GNAT family N-acetyltransferase [Acinetobacter sp. RIT592]
MKFLRIQSENNKYWNDIINMYNTSFPLFEQRTLEDQLLALQDEKYYCMALCESELLIGLLFYWDLGEFAYIEHFAISSNLRGKSYGSKVIKEFCKINKNVILEIDPPLDDVSIKRLNFYSKLGFKLQEFDHTHPSYRKDTPAHELKIMTYPNDITESEFNNFNNFLTNTVMKYSEI